MGSLTTFYGFGLLILQFGRNEILANECKMGFLSIGGVQGCFKVLKKEGRHNWITAKSKCENLDLRLVGPISESSAITLRKYLLENHDTGTFWLGGKTDGTEYVWEHGNTALAINDDLINKKNSQGECLTLSVNRDSFNDYPKRPYGIGDCSTKYAIICEESSNELSPQINGCPDCFEKFVGVEGCFKWSSNPPRNYFEAKEYCKSIGTHMGYTVTGSVPDGVTLRRNLLYTHGHATFWLGARAGNNNDVSEYVWEHDSTVLSSNDILWYPGLPKDVDSRYCLTLLADVKKMEKHGQKPYGKDLCRNATHTTLCKAKVNK